MISKRYENWLRYILKLRSQIVGLRFTTTWKCNSKCLTCNIWKMQDTGLNDLSVDEIDKFSRSKYFNSTQYITLSGGEPTLRDDLCEVITVLHKNIPTATFNMTTHGMNPQLEENLFKKIIKNNPDIKFGIIGLSLNGPPEIHEKTRGIKGSFYKVIDTYKRIKDIVPCAFSFTFCNDNVNHYKWIIDYAKKLDTFAYICWTVKNERFRIKDKDLVFWRDDMDRVLNDFVCDKMLFPRTFKGILKNIKYLPERITFSFLYDQIINKKKMPCYAGSEIVHIDPSGNVFPCNFELSENRNLGNLREKDFDEIWKNVPKKILKEIKRAECMYPNGLCGDSDIYPSIVNNPPAVIKWYLGKIIKGEELIKKK